MAEIVSVKNTGLRGITVADTKISFIDGEKGVLIYRGYRIEDLAKNSTFPEVALLLLNGVLPEKRSWSFLKSRLPMPGGCRNMSSKA
jgi:citrate synthase